MAFYIFFALFFHSPHHSSGHGVMTTPRVRGALRSGKFIPTSLVETSVQDHRSYFPAGSKDGTPGSGVRSQIKAAQPEGWTPFEPLRRGFKWRAGVCGDLKDVKDHRRGGRFYNNGFIVANYTQGGRVEVEMSIVAHHNGFIEMHVCDVAQCGGEISEHCFRIGACQQLKRSFVEECETGSMRCGPIDRKYPGRWHLPCSRVPLHDRKGWETYGEKGRIAYKLPKDLTCEHCVIQWFWSAANSCNPPGVIEYFDGPNAPRWGDCVGQAGAIGGVTRVQKPCGPDRFPEEYLACADVRIKPRIRAADQTPSPKRSSSQSPESTSPSPCQYHEKTMLYPSQEPKVETSTPSPSGIVESASPSPSDVVGIMFPSSSPSSTQMAKRTLTPTLVGDTLDESNTTGSHPCVPCECSHPKRRHTRLTWMDVYKPYHSQNSKKQSYGAVKDIVLTTNGTRVASLHHESTVHMSLFRSLNIEAVTDGTTQEIYFYVNRGLFGIRKEAPFYMFSPFDKAVKDWDLEFDGKPIEIIVLGAGDRDQLRVRFLTT